MSVAKKTRKSGAAKPDEDHPLRLEWVDPASLEPNPANWRVHPQRQVAALRAALAEVGWAATLLFNERTGRLVDGHARRDLAIEQKLPAVPVLVGSWTEEQERKILLTLDPLAGLAEIDPIAAEELLEGVRFDSAELDALARGLLEVDADAEDEAPGKRQVSFDAAEDGGDAGPGIERGEVVKVAGRIVACLDAARPATWPIVQQACRRAKVRAAVVDPDPQRCAEAVIQLEAECGRLREKIEADA